MNELWFITIIFISWHFFEQIITIFHYLFTNAKKRKLCRFTSPQSSPFGLLIHRTYKDWLSQVHFIWTAESYPGCTCQLIKQMADRKSKTSLTCLASEILAGCKPYLYTHRMKTRIWRTPLQGVISMTSWLHGRGSAPNMLSQWPWNQSPLMIYTILLNTVQQSSCQLGIIGGTALSSWVSSYQVVLRSFLYIKTVDCCMVRQVLHDVPSVPLK